MNGSPDWCLLGVTSGSSVFHVVRRFALRVLECLRFGFGMLFLLPMQSVLFEQAVVLHEFQPFFRVVFVFCGGIDTSSIFRANQPYNLSSFTLFGHYLVPPDLP
jgi:hypothetical protein